MLFIKVFSQIASASFSVILCYILNFIYIYMSYIFSTNVGHMLQILLVVRLKMLEINHLQPIMCLSGIWKTLKNSLDASSDVTAVFILYASTDYFDFLLLQCLRENYVIPLL